MALGMAFSAVGVVKVNDICRSNVLIMSFLSPRMS